MQAIEEQEQLRFSTYGLLTAERILDWYKGSLSANDLRAALTNPENVYYQMLQIPSKEVLNGIILQQAHDYQVYAQKLFVGYLMSGQNEKEKDAPGANIRQDIDIKRNELLQLNESFSALESAHQQLIFETQGKLMEFAKSLDDVAKLTAIIAEYMPKVDEIGSKARRFRKDFHEFILIIMHLLDTLPDYRLDEQQNAVNLAALNFDSQIGEEAV